MLIFSGVSIDGVLPTLDVLYYEIIADFPALRLMLNFIEHGGYYCCFYCYTKGYHDKRCKKRQYLFANSLNIRDPQSFELYARTATNSGEVIYGHLRESILAQILDIPLPISILCDYQHFTLLRHFRDVVRVLGCSLRPHKRKEIDHRLRNQVFPHFFHRKMRGIQDFSFIKASELRKDGGH